MATDGCSADEWLNNAAYFNLLTYERDTPATSSRSPRRPRGEGMRIDRIMPAIQTAPVAEEPILRLARPDEADGIDALMKASTAAIFPQFYDARQTAASVQYISSVDRTLIEDGTYFVLEADGELVGCGGWSRRDKLYTGAGDAAGDARMLDPATEAARVRAMFVRGDWTRRGLGTRILEACEAAARAEGFGTLALVATLPGVPLYARFGFAEDRQTVVTMPDGTAIDCVAMTKPVTA